MIYLIQAHNPICCSLDINVADYLRKIVKLNIVNYKAHHSKLTQSNQNINKLIKFCLLGIRRQFRTPSKKEIDSGLYCLYIENIVAFGDWDMGACCYRCLVRAGN